MKDEGLPAGQSFVDGGSMVAEILYVYFTTKQT